MRKVAQIICEIILIIAIAITATGCESQSFLSRKIDNSISDKNYIEAVDAYNILANKNFKKASEKDKMFLESIEEIVGDWKDEKVEYDVAIDWLNEFSTLPSDIVSSNAKKQIEFLEAEYEGEVLANKVLDAIDSDDYITAMKLCQSEKVQSSFSTYLQSSYNECKQLVLCNTINLENEEDYKQCIAMLDDYLKEIVEPDFSKRKAELEFELSELRSINNIITNALNNYNCEYYKSAFQILESGVKRYNKSEKMQNALDCLHNTYIAEITTQAKSLVEEKKYKEAKKVIENANAMYENEYFDFMYEYVCNESKFINRTKKLYESSLSNICSISEEKVINAGKTAKSYIIKSGKKLFLGDYSNESVTVVSMTGDIVASLLGTDVLFDIRDLSYDITHWGDEEYFLLRLGADAIAIVPIIGAVKYFKYVDEVSDGVKAAITMSDITSNINKMEDNVVIFIDEIKDATKGTEKLGTAIKRATKKLTKKDTYKFNYKTLLSTYKNKNVVDGVNQNTGVKYIESKQKYTEGLKGNKIKGLFPEFKSISDVDLPKDMYKAKSTKQFEYCTKKLNEKIDAGEIQESLFTNKQLKDIKNGSAKIDGLTWHHNEKEGLMQLVDEEIHAQTHHTGGNSLWGSGQ